MYFHITKLELRRAHASPALGILQSVISASSTLGNEADRSKSRKKNPASGELGAHRRKKRKGEGK